MVLQCENVCVCICISIFVEDWLRLCIGSCTIQGVREKVKAREEYPENPGQIECKVFIILSFQLSYRCSLLCVVEIVGFI